MSRRFLVPDCWLFWPMLSILAALGACSSQNIPQCDGLTNWPASMTLVHLNNRGVLDIQQVDYGSSEVTRVSSLPKSTDIHTQIHLVKIGLKDGRRVEAIAINDASLEECSISEAQVFLALDSLVEPTTAGVQRGLSEQAPLN